MCRPVGYHKMSTAHNRHKIRFLMSEKMLQAGSELRSNQIQLYIHVTVLTCLLRSEYGAFDHAQQQESVAPLRRSQMTTHNLVLKKLTFPVRHCTLHCKLYGLRSTLYCLRQNCKGWRWVRLTTSLQANSHRQLFCTNSMQHNLPPTLLGTSVSSIHQISEMVAKLI